MPVVGFLNSASPDKYAQQVAAFREGLAEGGYIEGQNVAVEYSWAEGQLSRLPVLVGDLLSRQVAVLVTGGSLAALTARSATATIPMVFSGADPVALGLANGLNRPGGNATGVNVLSADLGPKRLGLLRDLLPKVNSVAFLVNPTAPSTTMQISQLEEGARAIGVQLQIVHASRQEEFAAAFADLVSKRVDAMVVAADPVFNDGRDQLVTLAAHHAVPAVYEWREFADAGAPACATSRPGTHLGPVSGKTRRMMVAGECRLATLLTHSGSSNSGRPWPSEHWPCRALRAAGWVANAARFPVHFGITGLQQSNSVGEGHALN